MAPPDPESRLGTLSMLLQEVGAELRARREPEHLFTAALVGALGAVAWGVATIASVPGAKMIPWWRHPALAGALSCALFAAGVWFKVKREHGLYVGLRAEQARIAGLVAELAGVKQEDVPEGLRTGSTAGAGYLSSAGVIAASATAAIVFCVSVWLA